MGDFALGLYGVERRRASDRKDRIERIADFVERSNPQRSIRVLCGGEELEEVMEGITEGLRRLQERDRMLFIPGIRRR